MDDTQTLKEKDKRLWELLGKNDWRLKPTYENMVAIKNAQEWRKNYLKDQNER